MDCAQTLWRFYEGELGAPDVRTLTSHGHETGSAPDNPGVDISALQALVSECGGHLWMAAGPTGDMVLKIHLPRRALDDAESTPPSKEPRRAGLLRWLAGVVRQ